MNCIKKERGSVYCGDAVWATLNTTVSQLAPSSIFILTDSNTKQYCLPVLLAQLDTLVPIHQITIREGEINKNIATCNTVWQQLSEMGADRKSLLINLGGGVVTDFGGFVAATFRRGIECINIPTSLLAMVDASIGGKNGVDLGHVKNQIGVIRDPYAVLVSVSFLKTLPTAHIVSGYAEMLKHGLIASEAYWEQLKYFSATDIEATEALIWTSIEIKNKVVTQDPTEQGLRKTLNYGHTLGHAIESYCLESNTNNTLLHGEAVAIGMILANYISSELVGFPKQKLESTTRTILEYFPKHSFSDNDINQCIELLKYDKKNTNGNINFVLLRDFESYVIDQTVGNQHIFRAFDFYKKFQI